jgi:hypothetical protein
MWKVVSVSILLKLSGLGKKGRTLGIRTLINMKQRLTVFQMREWEKVNDLTGERIVKYYYAGFPEKGTPFEFSSNRDDINVHEGLMKFDKEQSEELDLSVKYDSFKGKMTFFETGSNVKPE